MLCYHKLYRTQHYVSNLFYCSQFLNYGNWLLCTFFQWLPFINHLQLWQLTTCYAGIMSMNNPNFENNFGQMYPQSLRSKTRRRAILLPSTWIYSCQSVGTIFSWFLPEKSSSRQSAFQWVRIVPLFSPTSFCIHTKRISYNRCSQRERNIKHLGSISLTGTSMMYCP